MSKKWSSFEDSISSLIESFSSKGLSQKVPLSSSLGRILATDIVAPNSFPAHETASMDGYACSYEDISKGTLKINGNVPAGSESIEIQKGECVKTFTGSLMSKGCDTLIPIENVTVQNGHIIINISVNKGFAVRPVGENYKAGEVLIKAGTKIGYCEIGIFAELGLAQISVKVRPIVGIIATGSEIVELGEELKSPAQIRSSNHFTLEALANLWGAEVINFGIVRDDKQAINSLMQDALKKCDIVVTSGGVSVGDYDFVRDIINDMRASLVVDGVGIKPGRHVRVVKIGEKYILSVPGFAYSAAVTFRLFGVPLIRGFLGESMEIEYNEAIMNDELKRSTSFMEFVACNVRDEKTQKFVDFIGKKKGSSAILNNLLDDAHLVVLPLGKELLEKGDIVKILRMF